MITTKISIKPHLAEYVQGRFEAKEGCVRFPDKLDIYHTIWNLIEKRPIRCSRDFGNLVIVLPDRREGKSPETYNYLGSRSQRIIEQNIEIMFWADLRSSIDYEHHANGSKYIETISAFMQKYGIESISEEALQKNYYRWRKKVRNQKKRAWIPKKVADQVY